MKYTPHTIVGENAVAIVRKNPKAARVVTQAAAAEAKRRLGAKQVAQP